MRGGFNRTALGLCSGLIFIVSGCGSGSNTEPNPEPAATQSVTGAALTCDTTQYQPNSVHLPSSSELAMFAKTYTGNTGTFGQNPGDPPFTATTDSAVLEFTAAGALTYNGAPQTVASICADNSVSMLYVLYGNHAHVDLFADGTFSGFAPDGTTGIKSGARATAMQWRVRNSMTVSWLQGITFANGIYVAVGNGGSWGTIITSQDATTWTPRLVPGVGAPRQQQLRAVAFGNGQFAAVGDRDSIYTSPDGISWTMRTSWSGASILNVAFGNGQFVAVGGGTNSLGQPVSTILSSPDGVTWTPRVSGTTNALYGVTFANGQYVVTGFNGTILTSPDGIAWTSRTSGSTQPLYSVILAGGKYMAVGGSGFGGTILTSSDAVTWTQVLSGANGYNSIESVVHADSQYVAVSSAGNILTSPDGVTWTPSHVSGYQLYDVIFANGQLLTVGNFGIILTSP